MVAETVPSPFTLQSRTRGVVVFRIGKVQSVIVGPETRSQVGKRCPHGTKVRHNGALSFSLPLSLSLSLSLRAMRLGETDVYLLKIRDGEGWTRRMRYRQVARGRVRSRSKVTRDVDVEVKMRVLDICDVSVMSCWTGRDWGIDRFHERSVVFTVSSVS